jgi:hypothetical protein
MTRGALLLVLMAVAIATPLRGATQDHHAQPVAALSWLVGGVWKADASKVGATTAEMRYSWSDNGDYIRFNMHFLKGNQVSRIYDGSFYWNPQTSSLQIWNMNGKNEVMEGPVKVDGKAIAATFPAKDAAEHEVEFRMTVTRQTDSRYHWSMEEKQPSGWKELIALDYVRSQSSSD